MEVLCLPLKHSSIHSMMPLNIGITTEDSLSKLQGQPGTRKRTYKRRNSQCHSPHKMLPICFFLKHHSNFHFFKKGCFPWRCLKTVILLLRYLRALPLWFCDIMSILNKITYGNSQGDFASLQDKCNLKSFQAHRSNFNTKTFNKSFPTLKKFTRKQSQFNFITTKNIK